MRRRIGWKRIRDTLVRICNGGKKQAMEKALLGKKHVVLFMLWYFMWKIATISSSFDVQSIENDSLNDDVDL